MAKNHSQQTWLVSDLVFVEIAVEHPIQKEMHVVFGRGTRIVISQHDQIPLAAELIEFLCDRPCREGGRA